MWLERFAVQSRESTPSPTPNRPYSPAPRKSTQLGPSLLQRRPGLQPRSSSVSVTSLAASTDSLPTAARVPNGVNLKNQLKGSANDDTTPPLEVLESILGSPKHENYPSNDKTPPVLIQEINFNGLSLQQFADSPLEQVGGNEAPVPLDFEKEKHKFEDLHKSISACDEVLESVETYLTSFQTDLAAVSAEIETLQNRSTSLNNRLQNRKAVDGVLGPEVDALSIPPSVVRKITEGAVDESWVKSLQELEKRSRSIDAKIKEGRDIKAAQDIQPLINDVSAKAVERIRDYVVAQIKALRSPSMNAQIIQQNSFLRYKDVFAFLAKQQPGLAEEISHAYVNTMHWYYSHSFTRYKAALDKLDLHVIDQMEVIASEGNTKRTAKAGTHHDAFSIGRRTEMLRKSNDTALPSFAAEDDRGTHYLEVPFRAFNLALMDNASAEYSFLTEFFPKHPSQATNRQFNEIFNSTFELGHAFTKQLIEQSFDAIGVLVCLRLAQHFAFELQRRKVPAMENYINGINMLLWPRFQIILDAHCESIRKITSSLSGKPAGSALSLTSSPSTAQTTAPHPVTQRFANFIQGILALSSEAGDNEPLSISLGRLRTEFDAFLIKLSKGIAEARKRERFLYNNYSLICTIIDTGGNLAEEIKTHFTDLKDALNVES